MSILDVGGKDGTFVKEFLQGHRGLSVDKTDNIDGTNLPFSDGEFDVVTSIDVLEHVPFNMRPLFIRELIRVCRLKVFLAFPHSGATGANIVVNSFTNGWLQEHIDLGLPAAEDVEKILSLSRVTFRKICNLDQDTWVAMIIADWYAPAELKRALNYNFNRNFYRREAKTTACYRLIYEINKGKKFR